MSARRFTATLAKTTAACAVALIAVSSAWAQTAYPTKPIRLVVGFTAGGISDVIARSIAVRLSSELGQQVYVENRPGAGTTIASDLIARAEPDGYTLMLQDVTTHAINATLYPKLSYDTVKSFTPVAMVASTPLMLVVNPSSPAKNVNELISMLKAKPGGYSYGSSGNGTIVHLTSEMFNNAAKVDTVHVPYKGSSPATQAILGGEVAFVFSSMPPAIAAMKGNRLRALAVTTPRRVDTAPDVPTMMEAGVPNFEVVLYNGIMGPANMPADVVQKLNGALAKVVATPEIKTLYESLGADAVTMSPNEFGTLLNREVVKYGPIVKATGARVQ
ncbi:MFS transporter [Pigmentiphaga litoralis]|jgi:tripartite-type tricarboxylate transporter receptor subunit TctC|uniref:Bug family tripartite tricarboxylate transporter substrate binding protein n=1 Tax=Pigmentiphaga litoralis TaxID=516702 RepID=UPI001677250B|nr:tripartite tricarboxylate transporter substrate binding protein [Pigmentiphaga litoralis]GGX33626.1 MFS transporter [Pigmentiphaga litoralis]